MDLEDKLKIEHERKKRAEEAKPEPHKVDLELHMARGRQALYVNGVLYRQDTYMGYLVADFLENAEYPLLINSFTFDDYDASEPVYEYVSEKGRFPATLEQLYSI